MTYGTLLRNLMLALVVSVGLTACGFQPIYSEYGGTAVATELRSIEIAPIKKHGIGREVYTNLINEFAADSAGSTSPYILKISLEEISEGLAVEEDAAVTRYNYQLFGDYSLIDRGTNKVLFKGSSRSITAYNVVDNQFATLTAKRDAKARAAKDLSQAVKLRLSLYFRQSAG